MRHAPLRIPLMYVCVCVRVHGQLGGHRRGKKKRDEMAQLVRKQRAQAQSDKQ